MCRKNAKNGPCCKASLIKLVLAKHGQKQGEIKKFSRKNHFSHDSLSFLEETDPVLERVFPKYALF